MCNSKYSGSDSSLSCQYIPDEFPIKGTWIFPCFLTASAAAPGVTWLWHGENKTHGRGKTIRLYTFRKGSVSWPQHREYVAVIPLGFVFFHSKTSYKSLSSGQVCKPQSHLRLDPKETSHKWQNFYSFSGRPVLIMVPVFWYITHVIVLLNALGCHPFRSRLEKQAQYVPLRTPSVSTCFTTLLQTEHSLAKVNIISSFVCRAKITEEQLPDKD